MTPLLWTYVAAWGLACAVAVRVAARHWQRLALSSRAYWRHLGEPWKVAVFLVAWFGIVAMAPYTGDPTWDWIDASFMAILAYTTGPFAVGTLFRALRRGERSAPTLYVAVVVWLFSASWSYDGYLLLKNGRYPETWFWNLVASSWLYLMAGVFWSLAWSPERGVHFAFTTDPWPPRVVTRPPARLYALALLLALPVAAVFLWFLLEGLA